MKNILVFGGSGLLGYEIVKNLRSEFAVNPTASYFKNQRDDNSLWFNLNLEKDETYIYEGEVLDAMIFSFSYLEEEILNQFKEGEQLKSLDYDLMLNHMKVYSSFPLKVINENLEKLQKSSNPNIVFIGSLINRKAVPTPIPYSLSRAIYKGLTESLAKEMGGRHIKVNLIAPGILNGGLSSKLPRKMIEHYLKHCGLRRLGEASEVAKVVNWFAINNTYITGKTILLDGGL